MREEKNDGTYANISENNDNKINLNEIKDMMFYSKEPKIKNIFDENMINKICLGIKNYFKFKKDKQRIDKMHQENKEILENNFHKERKELEERIVEYVNEINKLDQQTHITEYDKVNAK